MHQCALLGGQAAKHGIAEEFEYTAFGRGEVSDQLAGIRLVVQREGQQFHGCRPAFSFFQQSS